MKLNRCRPIALNAAPGPGWTGMNGIAGDTSGLRQSIPHRTPTRLTGVRQPADNPASEGCPDGGAERGYSAETLRT